MEVLVLPASLVFLAGFVLRPPIGVCRRSASVGLIVVAIGLGLAYAGPSGDANIGAGLIATAGLGALSYGFGGSLRRVPFFADG